MKKLFFVAFLVAITLSWAHAADEPAAERFIGEFSGWNIQVPEGNYLIIKGAIIVFGTRWGKQPQNEQELEDSVWEQLVLSYEAHKRSIVVEDSELEAELTKMLASEKVEFDRTKDRDQYEAWVKERTKESVQLFENQLRHLIQLEKLRKELLEGFTVEVSEQEARDEFIKEYNTLELELVEFEDLEKAKTFFAQMTPEKWEDQLQKDPKFAKKLGFVSSEFLIDIWKIPAEDISKMLGMEINSLYPPTTIYKNYGVFRIKQLKRADPAEFPKLKDSYVKQVEMIKKYGELNAWLARTKREAGIKVFQKKTSDVSQPS